MIHEITLDKLGLSDKTREAFLRVGIGTVEELSNLTADELIRVPSLGRKGIAEVTQKLHELGVSVS